MLKSLLLLRQGSEYSDLEEGAMRCSYISTTLRPREKVRLGPLVLQKLLTLWQENKQTGI